MRKIQKLVLGTRPANADGLLICPDVRGDLKHPIYGWRLYRTSNSSADWISLKLIRTAPAAAGSERQAGNYWLGWSPTERRLSGQRDTQRLPADLREYVEMWMGDEQFGYPSLDEAEFTTLLAMADRLDQAMS